jgi:6-phosphogluconolactonase (cycloisomerase 2 family)
MKICRSSNLLAVVLLSILIEACGGGNNSGSGGSGTPPPTGAEVLYAVNGSNEVFSFSIDQTTGSLSQTATVSPGGETVNNYALAITPSGSFLYAANDVVSGINGYSTNSSGTLSLIAGSPFIEQPPSLGAGGLAIDSGGRFLYVASQSGFGVVGFTIDSTSGALTPIPGAPFSTENSPSDVAIDPTGTFLYVSTLNDDAVLPGHNIWAFTIDTQTGALAPIFGSPFATIANGQPAQLQVDPSGQFLYVALSNSNCIAAFTIDSATGALTPVTGSPFPTASTEFTQTSSLAISPSGNFLFAFNFNGSTVAAFTIESGNGILDPVAGSPFPTNPNAEGELIVDPSDKFLYLTVGAGFAPPSAFVIFDIDASTGVLTPNASSPFAGTQEPFGLAVSQSQ